MKNMLIAGAVAASVCRTAAHAGVALVDSSHRPPSAWRIAEDRVERGVQRAMESSERVPAEIGMLVDTGSDQRMSDL